MSARQIAANLSSLPSLFFFFLPSLSGGFVKGFRRGGIPTAPRVGEQSGAMVVMCVSAGTTRRPQHAPPVGGSK